MDVLSALPLGRALGSGAAGLLRLIKVAYLFRSTQGWRRRTVLHPTVVRLGFFFFWMSLFTHWLACGWIFLGGPASELGTTKDVVRADGGGELVVDDELPVLRSLGKIEPEIE